MNQPNVSGSQDSKDPPQGKSDDNPTDNPNIKALQQKLTEKDKSFKELQTKFDEQSKKFEEETQKTQGAVTEKEKKLDELQAKLDSYVKSFDEDRTQRAFEKIKTVFPNSSETVVKLLLKDKKNNIEEVKEVLAKQNEALGIRSIEKPNFSRKEVADLIIEIKSDDSLTPDEKLAQISKLKRENGE